MSQETRDRTGAVSLNAPLGLLARPLSGQPRERGKRMSPRRRGRVIAGYGTLCQAAWVVSCEKDCYLATLFRGLASRRWVKRAVTGVAHTMLIIGSTCSRTAKLIKNSEGLPPADQIGGTDLEQINKDRFQRYFLKRPRRVGLKITLEPLIRAA